MKYRKHLRLKDYDYSADGFYFVTVCTNYCAPMIYEDERQLIQQMLEMLPSQFKGVNVDTHVIMQNHVHIIFELHCANVQLCRIVQVFKSISTLKLKQGGFTGQKFWQSNYFEHVIRNEKGLSNIRAYIINNPLALKLKMEEFYDN